MELDRKSFLVGATAALLTPSQVALARQRPISQLPSSKTKRFAWTIDDGVSNRAVKHYLDLVEKRDLHLTFFVTSCYPSWRKNKSQILDLVEQGKLQLANHTVSHRDLTTSSDPIVKSQLKGCHNFLLDTFGVDARPYFRPTYGYWTKHLIKLAAELGYTVPVMWYGSLGDGYNRGKNSTLNLADKWIVNGRIVIDHANVPKSSHDLLRITEIIQRRGLKAVTLREAFGENFS
ncbi:MAG: polysaccharide deacetylase family protein [Rhodoluna sp.]